MFEPQTKLTAGDLVLDLNLRKVSRHGEQIRLHPIEFDLLTFFCLKEGQIVSPQTLWEKVWQERGPVPDTVRAHIKTLRRKIDTDGTQSYIHTIHGRGYRFVAMQTTTPMLTRIA